MGDFLTPPPPPGFTLFHTIEPRRNPMQKLTQIGMIALIFTAGCLTASVVQQIAVPALQAGSSATKWEQTCVHWKSQRVTKIHSDQLGNPAKDEKDWDDVIKEWGSEGWELVETTYFRQVGIGYVCFKRPM